MQPEPAKSPTAKILVVDDEHLIRDFIKVSLELDGYSVLTAHNAAEALAILEQEDGAVSLLFVDLCMPDMDGNQLLRAVREVAPKLPAILMSGHSEDQIDRAVLEDGFGDYLQKPFTRARLRERVRARLD